MPGIAWVVIVVWGSLTGSALWGPPHAWSGTDPIVHTAHYKPAKVEYFTWLSSPEVDHGVCHFTAFALVTRNARHRLRVNGVELELDWSWSWPVEIPVGMSGSGLMVEFINPVSGSVVARHNLGGECWPKLTETPYYVN